MPDHVYRIIQVAGSSEKSIEDAIQTAVGRASRTLRQVGWFEVLETRGPCRRRQGGALPGHPQSRIHARRRRLTRETRGRIFSARPYQQGVPSGGRVLYQL
jgi:flavin-binding protein dodecin